MCALLSDGSVKCCGDNEDGRLGLGDTQNRGGGPGEMGDALPAVNLGTDKTAMAIATGYSHTCALLVDGSVKCWGQKFSGSLGLGDIEGRGDEPGEMGDALPAVDLGTGRSAKAIAAGDLHACALLDNDAVKCWGANSQGQLGLGDVEDRGDGPGEMGDKLPAVDLGAGVIPVAITVGNRHACARLTDDFIKCWGLNNRGQLGLGDTQNRGDAPGEMGKALPAVIHW
jgi:E3 ubiquitin-protein ligase HERC3